MADLITLTQQPIRITANQSAVLQPIYLATDIGGYDFLDMEAGLVANEGSVNGFQLDLYTGMQNQTDDGWVSAGSALLQTTGVNSWNKVNFPNGLLRYVRWRVSSIGTVGTAITFFIRGMARRYL